MRDSLKTKIIKFRMKTSRFRQLPKMMVVGYGKSGTTSIYNHLIDHPQITKPFRKEIEYFTKNYEKGLDWYKAHFPMKGYTIDVSPMTIHSKEALHRTMELMPDLKYCVIFRDPVDRAYSAWKMARRDKVEKRSFEQAIEDELIRKPNKNGYGYILPSIYINTISHLFEHIPKKNIFIIDSEDLRKKTDKIMNELFKFMGLPEHHNKNYNVFNEFKSEDMKPETREFLTQYFRPYQHKLRIKL